MSGPFTFPVAQAVPFDGTEDSEGNVVNPPFVSENVKDGIIEARDEAPGKARAHRLFTHNGTLGDNFWHGYSNLIPSNTTPMIIPWDCVLKEYSLSANRPSMDGRMDFYLNGLTGGDIVYSIQFNNVNTTLIDFPELSLNAGDLLRLRWVDQGQNPRDAISTFDFLLT